MSARAVGCAHCRTIMTPISLGGGMDFLCLITSAYYCEKKDCPRAFLLAVGGFFELDAKATGAGTESSHV